MKTIHLKGWGKDIDLVDLLSDRYEPFTSGDFPYGAESDAEVENVFLRFYYSDKECSLDEAVEGNLRKLFGDLKATGECHGYSEYTIEGFFLSSLTLGGHNLNNIFDSYKNHYLHILIDVVGNSTKL